MVRECELKEQVAQPTLSVRTRTPVQDLPKALGAAYSAIAQYMCELGEQRAGAPYVAYHNMDMQGLDIEIGIPVSKALAGRNVVRPGEIPPGTYATCLHTGPYAEVSTAYEALARFAEENRYTLSGLAYEMYLNDPSETPAEELLTQIAFLLESEGEESLV